MHTDLTRRAMLMTAAAAALLTTLPRLTLAQTQGDLTMATIKTQDGTSIYYKDWGRKDAQPVASSTTAGPSRATTGTTRCCSSLPTATV